MPALASNLVIKRDVCETPEQSRPSRCPNSASSSCCGALSVVIGHGGSARDVHLRLNMSARRVGPRPCPRPRTGTRTKDDRSIGIVTSPTKDPRRTDGVPEVRDVLQHREVEIDVVMGCEESQMSWAHAGCVEVCLELGRWCGIGGCSKYQGG